MSQSTKSPLTKGPPAAKCSPKKGPSTSATTASAAATKPARKYEGLTEEELAAENRRMVDQLAVTLEFKRMLEHMFYSNRQAAPVLRPYEDHFERVVHRFEIYSLAFRTFLEKYFDNLDSPDLTNCFDKRCPLGCNHEARLLFNEFGETIEDPVSLVEAHFKARQAILDAAKKGKGSKAPVSGTAGQSAIAGPSGVSPTKRPLVSAAEKQLPPTAPNTSARAGTSSGASTVTTAAIGVPLVSVKQEFDADHVMAISTQVTCKVVDCGRTFDSLAKVHEHYKEHSKLFKCAVCQQLYADRPTLVRHFVIHTAQPEKAVPAEVLAAIRGGSSAASAGSAAAAPAGGNSNA